MNDDILVGLDQDHPGFRDKNYVRQRDLIAQMALDWRAARTRDSEPPMPEVNYHDKQHQVWGHIYRNILSLSDLHAVHTVAEGLRELHLNADRIPSLQHVNTYLTPRTGFRVVPVTGLVKSRFFFGSLVRKEFFCTQYIRHESVPDFTPEPDICHDVIGHVPLLMSPEISQCYIEFAQAAVRAKDEEILALERLYWFTVEYGLCRENGQIKTWGAGNLSSISDLKRCVDPKQVNHARFDIQRMCTTAYDPTLPQPLLFVADSLESALAEISEYLHTEFINTSRPILPLD